MEKFKPDAETMNAVIRGLGAIVFAIVRRLPEEEHAAFAADIASLARIAERSGHTTLETLLLDLHQAAARTPRP